MQQQPTLLLAVVLTLILLFGLAPPLVAAGDQWTNACTQATPLSPGTYSGTVGYADIDWVAFDVAEGDSLAVSVDIENRAEPGTVTLFALDQTILTLDTVRRSRTELREYGFDRGWYHHDQTLRIVGADAGTVRTFRTHDAVTERVHNDHQFAGVRLGPGTMTFRLHATTAAVVCLGIAGDDTVDTGWTLAVAYNASEPPAVIDPAELETLYDALESRDDRIAELESLLDERQEQDTSMVLDDVDDLRDDLADTIDRLDELEDHLAALEDASEIAGLEAEILALEASAEQQARHIDDLETELATLETELAVLKAERDALRAQLRGMDDRGTMGLIEGDPQDRTTTPTAMGRVTATGGANGTTAEVPGYGVAVAVLALLVTGLLLWRSRS